MATNVKFSATFKGGSFGFAEFRILHNGLLSTSFVIQGTGNKTISMEDGMYLISVKGAAPPSGATININKDTSPATPEDFEEGPIYSNYVVTL